MGHPQFKSTKLAPGQGLGWADARRSVARAVARGAARAQSSRRALLQGRGRLQRQRQPRDGGAPASPPVNTAASEGPARSPASLASFAAPTPSEIWLVAIWTPKHDSLGALARRARSTRSPLDRGAVGGWRSGPGGMGGRREEWRGPPPGERGGGGGEAGPLRGPAATDGFARVLLRPAASRRLWGRGPRCLPHLSRPRAKAISPTVTSAPKSAQSLESGSPESGSPGRGSRGAAAQAWGSKAGTRAAAAKGEDVAGHGRRVGGTASQAGGGTPHRGRLPALRPEPRTPCCALMLDARGNNASLHDPGRAAPPEGQVAAAGEGCEDEPPR
jgi:hypothetical protein